MVAGLHIKELLCKRFIEKLLDRAMKGSDCTVDRPELVLVYLKGKIRELQVFYHKIKVLVDEYEVSSFITPLQKE